MGATGIPAVDVALVWGGVITVLASVTAVVWRGLRGTLRLARRVEEFMDDWAGEEERPGVPGRPGVMARVSAIEDRLRRVEDELYPNSGGSLRDAVDLANQRLARLCPEPDECGTPDLPEPPDPATPPSAS
ncbi:hypothetical protein [Streptomyces halobius]|uniref:Uncharacterized protein n=1 Tax=Streptomyces halobius TaxID=2879846 RepID=A0ABY4MCT5_9ACTN|nr:hypothetical protein [Streptomyces halobius]UQA95589.1 hypothetical protein K9S39_30360 [Streptomyces halobius]